MQLSSKNIEKVILECLFDDGEDTSNHKIAIGIRLKIGFHPGRLKANEDNILSMLKCLPDEFMQTKGGGSSFMDACIDREGNQWAYLHDTIEKLVVLGVAIEKLRFTWPRDMWSSLSGGMPYITVIDN